MTNNYQRDLRGRFTVSTANAPESSEGKFPTQTELGVTNTSSDDTLPGMEVRRHAPSADDLAQGGQQWPVHRRIPVMVAPDDSAGTIYGSHRQSAWTREAARRQGGDTDPARWLLGADDGLPPDVRGLIAGFTPRAAYAAPESQEGADDGRA